MFNANIFNEDIFNMAGSEPTPPVDEVVKTGTGGIDPVRRQPIIKPTGILHLPAKARKDVAARLEETRDLDLEIAGRLSREFLEDVIDAEAVPAITQMSMPEIEREIKVLLHKKMRTEGEEIMLLLLIVAVAV